MMVCILIDWLLAFISPSIKDPTYPRNREEITCIWEFEVSVNHKVPFAQVPSAPRLDWNGTSPVVNFSKLRTPFTLKTSVIFPSCFHHFPSDCLGREGESWISFHSWTLYGPDDPATAPNRLLHETFRQEFNAAMNQLRGQRRLFRRLKPSVGLTPGVVSGFIKIRSEKLDENVPNLRLCGIYSHNLTEQKFFFAGNLIKTCFLFSWKAPGPLRTTISLLQTVLLRRQLLRLVRNHWPPKHGLYQIYPNIRKWD